MFFKMAYLLKMYHQKMQILIPTQEHFNSTSQSIPSCLQNATVTGKQLPPSHKISKLGGSTFHLPLPLNKTLKRLPEPVEPLLLNGKLFILQRSVPTQNKIICQDLVDVKKVYRALCKLKTINPLYAQINLPKSALDFELADKFNECIITHTSSDSVYRMRRPLILTNCCTIMQHRQNKVLEPKQ